jgi:hypothetical protein
MNADAGGGSDPGHSPPPAGGGQAAATKGVVTGTAAGQISRTGWIMLWATAIMVVAIVFVIVIAITNP